MIENRFVSLETKISYQEKTIAELNDVVTAQQGQIAKLEARLTRLETSQEQGESNAESPHAQRPPHY